jgi:hypothetical protein
MTMPIRPKVQPSLHDMGCVPTLEGLGAMGIWPPLLHERDQAAPEQVETNQELTLETRVR